MPLAGAHTLCQLKWKDGNGKHKLLTPTSDNCNLCGFGHSDMRHGRCWAGQGDKNPEDLTSPDPAWELAADSEKEGDK